jgi:hypothetical protein
MAPRSVRFGVRSRKLSNVGRSLSKILSRVLPCFGRHGKPLVPAAFALGGGLWPVLLMYYP